MHPLCGCWWPSLLLIKNNRWELRSSWSKTFCVAAAPFLPRFWLCQQIKNKASPSSWYSQLLEALLGEALLADHQQQ